MAVIRWYRLSGTIAIPCSMSESVPFIGATVARTQVGPIEVSTVFIGLDQNGSFNGDPVLFETKLFDGSDSFDTAQSSTWSEAEATHARGVKLATARNTMAAATTEAALDNVVRTFRMARSA